MPDRPPTLRQLWAQMLRDRPDVAYRFAMQRDRCIREMRLEHIERLRARDAAGRRAVGEYDPGSA